MRVLTLRQPPTLLFGAGCLNQLVPYVLERSFRSVHFLVSSSVEKYLSDVRKCLLAEGRAVTTYVPPKGEPTILSFEQALDVAEPHRPDCVIGIGGGSVLDLAKLVAAFTGTNQDVRQCFGIDLLKSRSVHLICLPTTAGTGSEVSPNAILLDEQEKLKKGVISRFLVPDATFVDPELQLGVPADVTAFTGIDTLTHCVEAYTNKFAHPLVDLYALEGIRLTATFLPRAVQDGSDLEAREAMCIASLYGGMCLGPVNTAAVHALAYPLGGEFHMAHGVSNAVLLPSVFRFNAIAAPQRHADVAIALGAPARGDALTTALEAAEYLRYLITSCGIETSLASYGINQDQVASMTASAAKVTRLLNNNPRELTRTDIESIYMSAFS